MELEVLRMLSRDSADSRDEALRVLSVGELCGSVSASPSASSLHSRLAAALTSRALHTWLGSCVHRLSAVHGQWTSSA